MAIPPSVGRMVNCNKRAIDVLSTLHVVNCAEREYLGLSSRYKQPRTNNDPALDYACICGFCCHGVYNEEILPTLPTAFRADGRTGAACPCRNRAIADLSDHSLRFDGVRFDHREEHEGARPARESKGSAVSRWYQFFDRFVGGEA